MLFIMAFIMLLFKCDQCCKFFFLFSTLRLKLGHRFLNLSLDPKLRFSSAGHSSYSFIHDFLDVMKSWTTLQLLVDGCSRGSIPVNLWAFCESTGFHMYIKKVNLFYPTYGNI